MDDPARFSAALPPQSKHTGLPDLGTLTVVMPVLNAAQTLPGTLAALEGVRVIAADGGSRDATVAVATAAGAVVVTAAAGRGVQLAAGAAAATTEWLLFLHGDTCLGPGWRDEVALFMANPRSCSTAAVFRFRLDATGFWPALFAVGVATRGRVWGLPYGDQGLLIHRALYDSLGGYQPIPLMEDVEFVRRIGRRRLVFLKTPAVTSAVRYRRDGYVRRALRNLFCLGLFRMGVDLARIRRIYDA